VPPSICYYKALAGRRYDRAESGTPPPGGVDARQSAAAVSEISRGCSFSHPAKFLQFSSKITFTEASTSAFSIYPMALGSAATAFLTAATFATSIGGNP
jgi:hypothetical protein